MADGDLLRRSGFMPGLLGDYEGAELFPGMPSLRIPDATPGMPSIGIPDMNDLIYRPADPFPGMGLGGTPSMPSFGGLDATLFSTQGLANPDQLIAQSRAMPGYQSKGVAPATSTGVRAMPGQATAGSQNSLWGAIDQLSAGDTRVALAMKMAAQLESGGRLDAVGDAGQSHGPYQIYQAAHGRNITPEQSRDPFAATQYMLPEFQRAVDRVDPGLWERDPMRAAAQAAFLAERPAQMYDPSRVQQAYSAVTAPRNQGFSAGTSATEERDQQRNANNPQAVAVNIAAGVREGSLTPNQFNSGLAPGDAAAACGPAAAVAFARAYGRFPTLSEATDLARRFGWTRQGQAGPEAQVKLLNAIGVESKLVQGVDWRTVASELNAGRPVILDSPEHYFVVEDYDPDTGKFDFGNSALVLNKSGGRRWLSVEELTQMGYKIRSTIYMNV